MLWDELKEPTPCNNIIHITYYDEDKKSTSSNLLAELKSKYPDLYDGFPDDDIYTDLGFLSQWVAPLQLFQYLCNKYNVDIIGVAYEFKEDYVESFGFKNQFVDINLEEIEELPKAQDEAFLDDECPADYDPDKLDLTDEQIADLK